jgi:hypothetical protein
LLTLNSQTSAAEATPTKKPAAPSTSSRHPPQTQHSTLSTATSTTPPSQSTRGTDDAFPWYRCDDHSGIISDFQDGSPIGFTDEEADGGRELKYMSNGTTPENYALELEGMRMEGTFFELGNQTTWAFRFVRGQGVMFAESKDRWDMRLLGKGQTAKDGEVEGFLKVVGY